MKNRVAHSGFRKLSSRLWILEGALPKSSMPRNMLVYLMPNGGLCIHSCIAVDDRTRLELESFGQPEFLIVPSPLHKLDAPVYKALYPQLKVVAPRAARIKVQEKIPLDGFCEDVFRNGENGIRAMQIPGVKPVELCYELDLGAGAGGRKALVFNDSLMNLPTLPGFEGLLLRLLGSTGFFGMTRIGRLMLLKNKEAFGTWLKSQSHRIDLELVTVSHGAPITEMAAAALESAASRL